MLSEGSYNKQIYESVMAQGLKQVQSEFTIVFNGYDDMWLLVKTFNDPIFSAGESIEIAQPTGTKHLQPTQGKAGRTSPITFYETVKNHVQNLSILLVSRGGLCDAKIYHGTPTSHIWMKPIYGVSLQLEDSETDTEASEAKLISGTISLHYFGEIVKGNVTTLYGIPAPV